MTTLMHFTSAVGNHLWQSTLLAAVAWLLTLALRKNQARTRYWLWMIASAKFLVPFSFLVAMGGYLRDLIATPIAARPELSAVIEQIATPFPQPEFTSAMAPSSVGHNGSLWPVVLFALWTCGFLFVAFSWGLKWWRVRAAVRAASRSALVAGVPVLSSQSLLEPGIFGIFRPVLMLPEGITERLTPAQVDAIIAHEMCHVRRRDNLTAAIHMFVEAAFWFHPLVWWIGSQMVEERERACDEEVLHLGGDPEIYAEGILNVCKFYVESPLTCVSGISGSYLKQRIVRIMTARVTSNLDLSRKLLLGTAALLIIATPIVFGLENAKRLRAESPGPDWQIVAGTKMAFDVASVKPNKSGSRGTRENLNQPGGYVNTSNFTLEFLIEQAYFPYHPYGSPNTQFELSGTSGWMKSERFDIEARAEGNPTVEQKQLMLQSLLADRFKLAVHREIRQLPIYALIPVKAGKIGPQLIPHTDNANCVDPATPASPASASTGPPLPTCGLFTVSVRDGGFSPVARNVTMEWFAANLSGLVGRLVKDRTEISGTFDLTLHYVPDVGQPGAQFRSDAAASDPSAPPSIFTALQDQLGLKLDSQTGPVEVLVVDHAEEPSGN